MQSDLPLRSCVMILNALSCSLSNLSRLDFKALSIVKLAYSNNDIMVCLYTVHAIASVEYGLILERLYNHN